MATNGSDKSWAGDARDHDRGCKRRIEPRNLQTLIAVISRPASPFASPPVVPESPLLRDGAAHRSVLASRPAPLSQRTRLEVTVR